MSLCIGVLGLLLVQLALAQPFIEHCKDQEVHMKYHIEYNRCMGQALSIRASDLSAKVECMGNILDCSKLPQLSFAGAKPLDRLVIGNCTFNSSLACLLSALNATGTDTLVFRAVSTETLITTETMQGLDMLENLIIENALPNTKTMIPIQAIKALPNLKKLRIDSAGEVALTPDMFNTPGIPGLTDLHVVHCTVSQLPEYAFNGLAELRTLILQNNSIDIVDIDTFEGLNSLQELILNRNNISSIPTGLLRLRQLRFLSVLGNGCELVLEAEALAGLKLTELILQSDVKLILEPRSLFNVTCSGTFELVNSNITALPAHLFQHSAAVNLILNNNYLRSLPDTVFEGLDDLKILDLTRNKLTSVSRNTFKPLVHIEELYLHENFIQVLPEYLFSTLSSLHTVSLAHNNISHIHQYTFHEAAVKTLDLSHNQLNWTCYNEKIRKYANSPLATLSDMLVSVDLGYNNISGGMCTDWTGRMNNLRRLNLEYNNITYIRRKKTDPRFQRNEGHFLSNNLTVDLQNNFLTTLYPIKKTPNFILNYLVGDNPFICDCNMYYDLKNVDTTYDITGAKCGSPFSMKETRISLLLSKDFNNPVSIYNLTCPLLGNQNCACIVRPAKSRLECNCDDSSMLPKPNDSGQIYMMLKLRKAQFKSIPSFVNILNLSNLGLTMIPDLPKTVRHIDLSHNKLSKISLEFLQRNSTIELKGNPIKCDCWRQNDVENIINNKEKIIDYNSLICTDKVKIDSINIAQLCALQNGIVIGIPVGIFALLLVIIGVYYIFPTPIKKYVYYKLKWTWLIDEKLLDSNKKWDIFVSFAHNDEAFLKQYILPILEKYYKVCLHNRDWEVGEVIETQIYKSVEDSRRTLILLSNEYMDPINHGWAIKEFDAANFQSTKDEIQRSVVILLNGVNIENAPKNIKMHLDRNTYIKWDDTETFWIMLHRALLPRTRRARDQKKQLKAARKEKVRWQENIEKNEKNVMI